MDPGETNKTQVPRHKVEKRLDLECLRLLQNLPLLCRLRPLGCFFTFFCSCRSLTQLEVRQQVVLGVTAEGCDSTTCKIYFKVSC